MQVVRDQMRQMQHRLQQKRLRDARTVQGVPHRVFPLCSLQPTAHPGRRICAAGGWAFLPSGPRCGGEGQPGSWRPSQSLASSAAAANGRYFSKQREAGGKGKWGLSQNASFLQPGSHRVVVNVTCNKQYVLIAAFPASFPTLTVYLEWTSARLHVWLYLGTQHSPLVHTCIHKPKQYCQLYFGLQPMAY